MKRFIGIILLSIYLISTTELKELLKFPTLIEHYFEHKAKDSDITLLDFLTLHYTGNHLENHPIDDDYKQDQKLPFCGHTEFLSFNFISITPTRFEPNIKFPINKKPKTKALNKTFFDSKFLSSIWQPPKSC